MRVNIRHNIYEETDNENQPLTGSSRGAGCMAWVPKRYILVIMVFFGFFNIYALRVIINVSIVAITSNSTVSDPTKQEPEFTWTKTEVGVILSSFFYGSILTQMPGGVLAERVGGKYVFGGGVLGAALSNLLMPCFAHQSIYLLVFAGVLNGMFQGLVLPSVYTIWAKWAPEQEKSKFFNFSFSGGYFGTIIPMSLSGILAESGGGWPSIFYLFEPATSLVQDNIVSCSMGRHNCSHRKQLITMITELPSFIKFAMDFDLKKTGFLLSLMYIVSFTVVIVNSAFADFIIQRCHVKTVLVRKLCTCGGLVGVAIFTVAACHSDVAVTAVACLTVAVGLSALTWVGVNINFLDIAPQYSSVVMGIANTFAPISGIVSPSLTAMIVQNKHSREDWQTVFYVTAGISVFGAVIFGVFASGSRQSWAENTKQNYNGTIQCFNRIVDGETEKTLSTE